MSFLVVGGGKMGISHLALITPYVGKAKVALVERKRSIRIALSLIGYRSYASIEKAAENEGKPDGIIIATPTSSHAPLAEWAIANDVPFFVEKPLTLDAARSAALVEATAKAGVSAQTGFVMRYVASFQRLRWLVADGRLGAVKGYRASMRGNVITEPPKPGSWQGDFARGGGCLNEYGPHIIDLSRFLFGEVRVVATAEKGYVHSTGADDWVELTWQHASGVPGVLRIDWCDTNKRKSVIEFEAQFEAARVRVDNSAVEITWDDDALPDPATRAELEAPPQPAQVGYYLRGEEFSLEIEDFLGKCLGKSMHVDPDLPEGITPTLEDGYAVDRLIDEIARKAGLK
jgi:predicted dehydrogenase